MSAGMSERRIKAALRRLTRKHPGVEFEVLRASNGEVAILPANAVRRPVNGLQWVEALAKRPS